MSKRVSRLARRRKALGLTQEEVAAAADVDVSAIKRWELGKVRPSPKNRRALAEVLQVSLKELGALLEDHDSAVGIVELASDQGGRIGSYKNCLQDAQGEILVSGTSLLHITDDSKDLLARKLADSCSIRTLIMDPDWIEENSGLLTFLRDSRARKRFRYEIDASIDRLHDLRDSVDGKSSLEVRSYRTIFPYIMTGYRSPEASCIVVEITDYIPSNERPRFTLVPNESSMGLFEVVVAKFNELWNSRLVRKVA